MARGPEAERLTRAVTNAEPETVDAASREWEACARVLKTVSDYLDSASGTVRSAIGGETGPAVDAAFRRSAGAMDARSTVLLHGSQALRGASAALQKAKDEEAKLRDIPVPTAYRAPLGNPTDEELHQQAQSKAREQQAASALADQEAKARAEADRLDAELARSTDTMKQIHGEPDPPPPPIDPPRTPTPASNGGSSAGMTGHAVSAPQLHGSGGHPSSDLVFTHPTKDPQVEYTPIGGGGDTGAPGGGDPGGGDPGGSSPSGTPTGFPSSPISSSELGTPGSSGAGPGVAGATAGGMAAGLIGAKLSGVLKGGLLPSSGGAGTAAGRGTAASAVRGIGSSARTGGAGTLGRSGAAPGASTAGRGAAGRAGGAAAAGKSAAGGAGAAGKSASGGRSGAGASGRSGSGAGGRGGSGGRGGAGVAGRSARGKDDEKGKKHELFDVGEDWVDDEGAAPGVLD
jgi:hypothetical protein